MCDPELHITGDGASNICVAIAREGENCWRVARAERVALLVDNDAYFSALQSALYLAQRSIWVVGWQFDPRTVLQPTLDDTSPGLGALLRAISNKRPGLDIRVLIWDMPLPFVASRGFFHRSAQEWSEDGVHFRLDRHHARGGCHHQKLVVLDERLAFCGGSELTPNRWDTLRHHHRDSRRRLPSGVPYPPRHAVTALVDGQAAAALGELVRERWRRATGEILRTAEGRASIWPHQVPVWLADVQVAIARTAPARGLHAAIRENEALYMKAIGVAQSLIYLENQYFASPLIGDALAECLKAPQGPEVIVVGPRRGLSLMDRATMDPPRGALIERLRSADRHGRFHTFAPLTSGGRAIVVHSKVMIIDDRFLRIGSSNLNNRSMGFDTECDVAIDACLVPMQRFESVRRGISAFRDGLIGHYLECTGFAVAQAAQRQGCHARAIDSLRDIRRNHLQRVEPRRLGLLRALIAEFHLGDPEGIRDSFRPWRRRAGPARASRLQLACAITGAGMACLLLGWLAASRRGLRK